MSSKAKPAPRRAVWAEPADLVEPRGDLRQFAWRHWLVFYRVREDQVLVLRIWDSRRAPDSLQLPEDPIDPSAVD